MPDSSIVPAPFTLSPAALREIERVRGEYLAFSPDDPPVMPGINLAQRMLDGGGLGPTTIVVGFWRASEFKSEAYSLVQRVSGLDLVFAVPPEQVPLFVGKEIDHTPDAGFYFRERPMPATER